MNNNLTTAPVGRLVRNIAVPASIGMFFNTMYNVVDTYYAGLISTQAQAALSLSFPVFFIIIAMGAGISTGANALISNALGSGDEDMAREYSVQAIWFALFIGILLTFSGFFLAPRLFMLLGASGEYLDISLSYMNIILMATTAFLLVYVLNSVLTAQGDTRSFRNFLILGFFMNLLLNPWFMFGGFGVPAMGIQGVALATFVVEVIGVLYMGYKAKQTELFSGRKIKIGKINKKTIYELSGQGFPASLNMMTIAVGVFIITYFISPYGESAVAAYGIATRIDQIALLPLMGLNTACLTLIGQNNGAKKADRVKEVFRTVMTYGVSVTLVGMIVVYVFVERLMGFFSNDLEVISIGVTFLKISLLAYWAYMILFLSVSAIQGLKRPLFAIWIGLYRQIGAPAIIFYLFGTIFGFGLLGIWWGIFIINWSAVIISLIYTLNMLKKLPANVE